MTSFEAFLLGLIQGVTEFLPVSSSGHLTLGQHFLGLQNLHEYTLFNMVCHLGTLAAILFIFFPLLKEIAKTNRTLFWQVLLGTLPLVPLVFILKPIKSVFNHPEVLGPCFIFTAILLFLGLSYRLPIQTTGPKRTWKDPIVIGFFQAIAIFPGISRSGATISAAQLLSWPREKAIQFSFLLAIPAILGGTLLEAWQVWKTPSSLLANVSPSDYLIGFWTSLIFGSLALACLTRLTSAYSWSYFAWYCLIIGTIATIYFNFLG